MYSTEAVAKQRGPVRRCANHVMEDKQSGTVYMVVMVILCSVTRATSQC